MIKAFGGDEAGMRVGWTNLKTIAMDCGGRFLHMPIVLTINPVL